MRKVRGKLTYPHVVSTLALFLALSGGVAFAASHLAKNSVGTKQLKNGAVTQKKISKATREALKGQTGKTGPAGPSGAGPAFGVFRNERFLVSSTDFENPTPIATLSGLPAGSYAITAKVLLDSTGAEILAKCKLLAPASGANQEVDEAFAFMGTGSPGDSSTTSFPLQMLHTFAADGGTVRLACAHDKLALEAINPRIQAIKVTSATNSAVTG